MSDAPWLNYEDDDDTAVADGPWSAYGDEQSSAPVPFLGMQEAANSIPLPGYTTPFGQDIERTARAMVQSQPSEQALEAGAFQNQRTLEPPPMPDGLAESGNMEGFGSMGNVDPALYRDTLRESVKQLTPSPKTVRSAREYTSLLGALVHPENPNSVDEALNRLAGPDLPLEDFDKAVAGGLGATYRQVESFLQPEQLPLLMAGSIPGKLGMAVTAAFYADMVRHSPEVFNKVVDALESGDPQREAEALTEAVVHGAFLGLTGKHTADSIRQGVDSFIQSNGPEARRRYYEQAQKSQQAADLAPLPQPEAFGVSTPEESPSPTTSVEASAPRDEIPRAEGDLGRPVPKTEEEIQHALSIRSSETLPVGEAPQDSREVGTGVPAPEEPAGTQGGTGGQPSPQPAETAPGEISLTLKPAIRGQGQVVEGIAGKSHADILSNAKDPVKMMAAMAGFNEGRGFVGPDGEFRTRKEAQSQLEEHYGAFDLMKPDEGLHSEDLGPDGKPRLLRPEVTITDPKYTEQAKTFAAEAMLKKVSDITPEDFRKLSEDYKKKTGHGLTQLSYDIGDILAKNGRDDLIDAYREAYPKANDRNNRMVEEIMGKVSQMPRGPEAEAALKPIQDMSSQPQFFNEVVQRAEWVKSGGVEHASRFKGETVPATKEIPAEVSEAQSTLAKAEKRWRRAKRQEPSDVEAADESRIEAAANLDAIAAKHKVPQDVYDRIKSEARVTETEAEPAPVEDKLRSPVPQVPIPEHFKSAEDVINFRNQRRSEELDLYKKEIGLTQEEAERLQAIMEREGSTQKFEKDIGPEKAQKLNDLFDGPQNHRDNPHGFRFWDYSNGFNPEDVATETDKPWIAKQLIWALQHDVHPNPESDRFLFSIVAARRLKELGGTKSDIARELDQYTTRNSGSSGDKAEPFVDNGKKISAFLKAHGIELPEGELGKSKTTPDPIIKALDSAIDRLGVDPSKSFADPFFVQSVGKPAARAALIAARAAYKTSKDVGQAIAEGLRNLHAAGVRFNATLTQAHAQQWLHSMLTAPKAGGLGRVLGNLNRKRQAFGTLFRSDANRKLMDQTRDAVDNMANIAGQQARKSLDIGTKPIEREAALAVIEANGDITKLDTFEQQSKAGDHAGAEKAVNYARANWTALQPLADRMKRLMNDQVADEHANGITTEYHEAYVPHIYDKDLWMGAGRPFVIGAGGGGGAATGFKKGRTFPTIFDAIEAGYHPQTLDVGKLAEHRVKNGQKLINLKQWGEMLSVVHDPTDGKSIVTALVHKSRGPGQPGYEVAPMGYTPREIIPGVRVAIHEGYSSLFDAMTATSRISGNAVGKMLLETEGAMKHGLLLFDTFHASRIIQKQAVLTRQLNIGNRGKTLLEYANSDLARAVNAGEITPEIARWVQTNRPVANLLIRSGLNVGRVSEALYTSFVRQIPGLGTFNKWVFEKLTRGALLQAGLIEFERVSKAMPGLSPQQVALKVSRDLNSYFGNLGRQGLFKSSTGQDLARLVFLAPNWVESMARTEVKGALQIAKGVTYDPIVHKKLLTGTIGKGVAQGLLAYFVGSQLLNLVTRGQPTWKNPEDKHKLDAWIPDLSGKGGHGFFISPFSVVAELTHDMIRYAQSEGTALKAAAKIAGNKLSPPARALKILATGRDFDKTHIDSTWGRVKAAGAALAPTPIPLAPIIKGTQYPGQIQRQLTASAGFKTEPAESPTQQIGAKAQKFLASQGKGHAFDFEPTEDPSYAKLRSILRRGDDREALGMLSELEKNHTGKQVLTAMRNHVRHPFTGSKSQERAFLGSLNDQEAGLYDKARDEQKAEYDNFLKLWYSRPTGAPAATNAQPAAISAPWLRY